MAEIPKYLAKFELDLEDYEEPIKGCENGSPGARLASRWYAKLQGSDSQMYSLDPRHQHHLRIIREEILGPLHRPTKSTLFGDAAHCSVF